MTPMMQAVSVALQRKPPPPAKARFVVNPLGKKSEVYDTVNAS